MGKVEVITGGMFAGKSEELIRRLRRATFIKKNVLMVKPALDNRYHATDVVSHAGQSFRAVPVKDSAEVLRLASNVDVLGVDEAQFFDLGIVVAVRSLAARGVTVIVAGLDLDASGKAFGPMPLLMAEADDVLKVHALCTVCGADASRSQRLSAQTEQVLVGGADLYEARCRTHWTPSNS